MDLRLCADIDPAGWLVENQDFRLGEKPATDQSFLLVASAQVLDAFVKISVFILSMPFNFSHSAFKLP